MSWGFSRVGKPSAVAKSVAEALAKSKCSEPEETIKAKAGEIIAAALAAFPDGQAVEVSASGSQFDEYKDGQHTGRFTNQLKIEIRPLAGFIE